MVDGNVLCIECDKRQKLALSSDHQCVCADDYELQLGDCVEVCGDGRLYELECDDGNTEDGDGRNSVCVVEDRFGCENGTNSSASQCFYTGEMSLSLNFI